MFIDIIETIVVFFYDTLGKLIQTNEKKVSTLGAVALLLCFLIGYVC